MGDKMQELFDFIREFGFPIVIGGYLVYWLTQHLDHKMDKIIELLEKLTQ